MNCENQFSILQCNKSVSPTKPNIRNSDDNRLNGHFGQVSCHKLVVWNWDLYLVGIVSVVQNTHTRHMFCMLWTHYPYVIKSINNTDYMVWMIWTVEEIEKWYVPIDIANTFRMDANNFAHFGQFNADSMPTQCRHNADTLM